MSRSTWRITFAASISAGATLALASPSVAAAPPGDNGTVKIHRSTTSPADMRNEPKVCTFYLVGFQFDPAQQVSWHIKSWPPTGDRTVVLQDTLTLNADGHGRTPDLTLPDGHYKLFWTFAGEHGKAKHKVFWVKCPSPSTTPTPTTPPGNNNPGGGKPGSPTPSAKPTTATPTPPTATPSDDQSPTTPPHKNASSGGGLPFTGSNAILAAGIALALILTGAGALMITRHKRSTPN